MQLTPDTPSKLPWPFIDGLFDYAGLFPPASLSMDDAVRTYLGHRSGPEAGIVGPFVVPVGRLQEAEAAFGPESAELTVLPRAGCSVPDDLAEDLAACRALAGRTQGRLVTTTIEMPIPHEPASGVDGFVRGVQTAVSESGVPIGAVYLEILRSPSFSERLGPYVAALREASTRGVAVRGKLRFGGATPEAYPSLEEAALFLDAFCRGRHPFKATAGLHHPFRHVTTQPGVIMHGFINVFTAAVLHRVHTLPMTDLIAILDERDPEAFVMRETGIGWRSWSATVSEVASIRRDLALGIGSCSIREPLDDLARYNLLSLSESP